MPMDKPTNDAKKDLAQLEEVLRKQVATHEQLLSLLQAKRAAPGAAPTTAA